MTFDELEADRDRLRAALQGMHRFWRKYPAFVHAPELLDEASEAVKVMNAALSDAVQPVDQHHPKSSIHAGSRPIGTDSSTTIRLTKEDTHALRHAVAWMHLGLIHWGNDAGILGDEERAKHATGMEHLRQARAALRKANVIRRAQP